MIAKESGKGEGYSGARVTRGRGARSSAAKLSDEGALDYVLERVDARSESFERRAFERLWFGNYNFLIGASSWTGDQRTPWIPRSINPNRKGYQANLILPKLYRAVAKVLQVNPTFRVAPRTHHRQDRHASKIAERVYDHLKQVTGYRQLRMQWTLDAALYGSGFLKICWDPDAGRPDRVWLREDGSAYMDPKFDPQLRQQVEMEGRFRDIATGEVSLSVCSPFQLHWPTSCRTDIPDAEWAAQVSYISEEVARERYGLEASGSQAVNQAELFERAMSFSAEATAGAAPFELGHVPHEGASRVREVELWERPLPRNNMEGRKIVLVGDLVAENGPNPYAKTENPIPYVKKDWFPLRGKRFIGLSLVEQLRQPQRAYNATRTHEINFARTAGHPRMLLPKNSGVAPVNLQGVSGQVLEINMLGGAPVFGPTPQLPPFIGDLRNVAAGEMDMISAQTEPAQSKLPGQVRSGSGISMVLSDQNLILTPTIESELIAQSEAGRMMLSLVGAYYDTPRVLMVLGRGNEFDPIQFMGSDLRGHTHLQIFGEPGPIESKEAYRARIMDMVELGLLNTQDPEDRMLALKAMEFGTEKELLSTKTLQEIAEEREIQRAIDNPGYEPLVYEWHDPETRMRVLEREMNSRDFEGYQTQTQTIIVKRWQAYVQLYQQRLKAQIQMMQATQGAPGPSGTPSRPKRAS